MLFKSLAVVALIGLISAQSLSSECYSTETETTPIPTIISDGNLGCGCNYTGLWLDIMLIVDSSSSMTQSGLQSLMSYIGTAMLQPTIGQGPGQRSRFGIISYSDDATLRYSLTDFNNVDDLLNSVFNIPFENAPGSNIEAGLRLANQEFSVNGNGVYANRKKVVIVAASHYESGSWNDPQVAAEVFKGNGGTLVTIEYVQRHGTPVPILANLSSPCAQLSTINEDLRVADLLDIYCRANCFCSTNWSPYSLDAKCGTPDQGCYWPVTIPAGWPLAQRYCAQQNGGTLATICEYGKAIFMTSLLGNRQEAQWTGLSRGADGSYTWDDGTSYAACQPSTNPAWYNGTAQPGQAVAQISPSGFQNYFFGAPEYTDYIYTCQNSPCSSTLYCQ